jgi:hypothetical protein
MSALRHVGANYCREQLQQKPERAPFRLLAKLM